MSIVPTGEEAFRINPLEAASPDGIGTMWGGN